MKCCVCSKREIDLIIKNDNIIYPVCNRCANEYYKRALKELGKK